ncbi:MAG: hypothetical protein D6698_15280, partial [Gammaproteobacteria bacterium]
MKLRNAQKFALFMVTLNLLLLMASPQRGFDVEEDVVINEYKIYTNTFVLGEKIQVRVSDVQGILQLEMSVNPGQFGQEIYNFTGDWSHTFSYNFSSVVSFVFTRINGTGRGHVVIRTVEAFPFKAVVMLGPSGLLLAVTLVLPRYLEKRGLRFPLIHDELEALPAVLLVLPYLLLVSSEFSRVSLYYFDEFRYVEIGEPDFLGYMFYDFFTNMAVPYILIFVFLSFPRLIRKTNYY